jgi:hypothetical protein
MNHPQAKDRLFDTTFLLGARRRRQALKFLFEQGDAEAVRILVDAVDRSHPAASSIREFLARITTRGAVDALVAAWAAKHSPWLGPIAVERALAIGATAALPLDRETAWLLVPHLRAGGERGAGAEAFVQRAIQAKPEFLPAFIFKLGRSEALEKDCIAAAAALSLLDDPDVEVREAATAFLKTLLTRGREAGQVVSLRHIQTPDAVRILVDAVDRSHPAATSIREFLARITARDAVDALVAAWTAKHSPWLGPIAVERALAIGATAALPLDRETAWWVAPHLRSGGELVAAAEPFVQRALQSKPEFLPAFICKIGRANALEQSRSVQAWVLQLLRDEDKDVRSGAEAWLKALPNTERWNDPLVDEWIRTESPFLASMVAEPRLPSNPAKEALIHLVHRNVAGYRKLEDRDGGLLAEALVLATPEMRKVINEVVLNARDGALADAYRRATAAGSQADPQLALRALMTSGNEDALFETIRGMTLGEVLPLCRHWTETQRRPSRDRHREMVDRAVASFQRMPEVEVEPAPPLPDGLQDLFEIWQSEKVSDTQLRQDLQASDPLVRARALFLGSEHGGVDEKTLRAKAGSDDWPDHLIVALRYPDALKGQDHVAWINDGAGAEGDLLGAPITCGPEELVRAGALCDSLRKAKGQGKLAARNLALAEILVSFRALSGGLGTVRDDDSAHEKGVTRVGKDDVSKEDLKF